MWRGNPVLTALVFGLPLGFLSLICYSICCADILDADDEEITGMSTISTSINFNKCITIVNNYYQLFLDTHEKKD